MPQMPSSDKADSLAGLEQIIAAYLQATDAGMPVDRGALMARHPPLAEHLCAFFTAQDQAPSAEALPSIGSPAVTESRDPVDAARASIDAPTLPPRAKLNESNSAPAATDRDPSTARGEPGLPTDTGRWFGDYELLSEI